MCIVATKGERLCWEMVATAACLVPDPLSSEEAWMHARATLAGFVIATGVWLKPPDMQTKHRGFYCYCLERLYCLIMGFCMYLLGSNIQTAYERSMATGSFQGFAGSKEISALDPFERRDVALLPTIYIRCMPMFGGISSF